MISVSYRSALLCSVLLTSVLVTTAAIETARWVYHSLLICIHCPLHSAVVLSCWLPVAHLSSSFHPSLFTFRSPTAHCPLPPMRSHQLSGIARRFSSCVFRLPRPASSPSLPLSSLASPAASPAQQLPLSRSVHCSHRPALTSAATAFSCSSSLSSLLASCSSAAAALPSFSLCPSSLSLSLSLHCQPTAAAADEDSLDSSSSSSSGVQPTVSGAQCCASVAGLDMTHLSLLLSPGDDGA